MTRAHILCRRPFSEIDSATDAAVLAVAPILAPILFLILTLILATPAVGATAQADTTGDTDTSTEDRARFFLAAGIGYSRTDVTLDRPDGTYDASGHGFNNGLLRLGYHLDPQWAIEACYQSWDEDGGAYKQIDLRLLTVGLAYYSGGPFARLEFAFGHLKTTLGVADLTGPAEPRRVIAVQDDADAVGIAAGVGYRFFLTSAITLTLEAEGAWLPPREDLTAVYGTFNAVLGFFVW